MENLYLDNVRYIRALISALEDFLNSKYKHAFSRAPPFDENQFYSDVTIIEKENGIVAGYFEYDVVKNSPNDIDDDFQDMLDMIDKQ